MVPPTAALRRALVDRASEIHHSNQGVQYACHDYSALLTQHKVQISMREQTSSSSQKKPTRCRNYSVQCARFGGVARLLGSAKLRTRPRYVIFVRMTAITHPHTPYHGLLSYPRLTQARSPSRA
jgi:hypothetical protein